jgi:16S rRNA (adenine1518-N6/adenine1519-N6)-dimethyltransferase
VANVRGGGPRARKSLGQHFLRDTGVLMDIAGAVTVPADGVLVEIGPGTGQLTEYLLDAGHQVIAVEIEARMLRHLTNRFADRTNLRLVEADARDLDFTSIIPPGTPFAIVGNLPYFAANPIIRHILEGEPKPTQLVVMVQREVGRELAAPPGHLSLLGISVQVYAAPELLFDVPPLAFDPPPKVHSSVVRLTLRPEPLVPEAENAQFFTFVSRTFRNPRKQIHNALGMPAEAGAKALAEAGVDPMRRPETLSIPEWVALMHAAARALADA